LLWNVLRDTFLCCSFDAVNCSQACGVGWSIAMRYFISSKLRIQHGVSRVSGRNWFCLTSHQLCRMLSLGDDLLRLWFWRGVEFWHREVEYPHWVAPESANHYLSRSNFSWVRVRSLAHGGSVAVSASPPASVVRRKDIDIRLIAP
jgi:hypothetical protein